MRKTGPQEPHETAQPGRPVNFRKGCQRKGFDPSATFRSYEKWR